MEGQKVKAKHIATVQAAVIARGFPLSFLQSLALPLT
jgi:hypothetical protein